jgi:hypothetical protein
MTMGATKGKMMSAYGAVAAELLPDRSSYDCQHRWRELHREELRSQDERLSTEPITPEEVG